MNALARYTRWLHTRWPAGVVEKLPEVNPDGTCNVPGVRIVGDLTGIPLLKFAADSGARAVQAILAEPDFNQARAAGNGPVLDLAIIGAGVSGMAAALEAKLAGLRFKVFEATEPFSTLVNFPKGKPIYTYPTDMAPAGRLQVRATVKEALVEELEQQRRAAGIEITPARIERLERKGGDILLHHADKTISRARRVVIGIGRSGNFRKLGCPGESLDKVFNRLHDPKEFAGRRVLVVGGGDTALETAIALGSAGAHVTLSYRRSEFSRPKPENVEKLQALAANPAADVAVERPTSERVTTAAGSHLRGDQPPGSVTLALGTEVREIRPHEVVLRDAAKREQALPNDVVFTMLGREAPLDFFRRSGIAVRGGWRASTWIGFLLFFAFCVFVYNWKSGGSAIYNAFERRQWFPFNLPEWFAGWSGSLGAAFAEPANFLGTLAISLREPGFYYGFAYTVCIILFGVARIRRRRTPYVTAQTLCLMAVQVVPLFLLPYLLLPWAGHNGWFDAGPGRTIADNLFPAAGYGHGREYWRAVGFILAWPLFYSNQFTAQPMAWWLVIGFVQTFVLIPLMIRRWGKGAYCGWICSCGALAETMGDRHRHKMPHGPWWNRLNMVGQVILAVISLLFALRVVSWSFPQAAAGRLAQRVFDGMLYGWGGFNYYKIVDLTLAGIVGVGAYFWFSGRVWCRFACPLAALMHIYARFSRYRIFAEKKKCISCNVCTSVCHQGIDIMNFANKGVPMEDPECVRCSACVQECPTGTLSFGRIGPGGEVILDRLAASNVQRREGKA
jgi:thioredoxin reductase/NAD-dependent dihydropyrimidine dehydrogenase PreA subunit